VGGVLPEKDETHHLVYIWGGGLHFISPTLPELAIYTLRQAAGCLVQQLQYYFSIRTR